MSNVLCIRHNSGIKSINFDRIQHYDVFARPDGVLCLRVFPLPLEEGIQFSLNNVVLLPYDSIKSNGIHLTLKYIAHDLKNADNNIVIPEWMKANK